MKLCYALALLATVSAVKIGSEPAGTTLSQVKSDISEITGNTKCDDEIPGNCDEDKKFEEEYEKTKKRNSALFKKRRDMLAKEEKNFEHDLKNMYKEKWGMLKAEQRLKREEAIQECGCQKKCMDTPFRQQTTCENKCVASCKSGTTKPSNDTTA